MNHPISRRGFLQFSLLSGSLLVSTTFSPHAAAKPQSKKENTDLTPLLEIHPDNHITFYYPSPEMGQGTDTSLAMLFAEELGADFNLIKVKPQHYAIRRNDKDEIEPVAVPQFSGGSTSISRNYTLIREAGAACREKLLRAAAEALGTPVANLSLANSFVSDSDGNQHPFSNFIQAAASIELPEDLELQTKSRGDWSIIGRPQKGKQIRDIVTGQPLYSMDMDYPGAKIALVARAPQFDADVKSVDDKAARKLAGVHDVVILPRPDLDKFYTYLAAGVAVIADDFWTAKKARDLLKIEWTESPWKDESTASLDSQCEALLKTKGQVVRNDGDYDTAIKNADRVITRTYKLPLVSHAQLEPQNCIAHVEESKCTLIGPMQSPGGASRMASELTGLDRLDIDIKYARLGGGFGRRLTSDHVGEAVMISKLHGGPVKLIWTREDDLAHDFYRPMGHHEMTAAFDADGKLTAWSQRLAGTPKHYRRNGKDPLKMFDADLYLDDFPANLVDNLKLEYWPAKSGAPQGSWRAPAHTANAFVIQSFLDELAEELGQDPLSLRLQLLGEDQKFDYGNHGGPTFDTGRLKTVLATAAEMANWGRKLPEGKGLGISGHFTFGGYCAQVAEITMTGDQSYKVDNVWAAIDVGTVINPEGVILQVEGGINDGLSAALGQQILVESGEVRTLNFDTYQMGRIKDSATRIDVSVIDSTEPPSGAGEMGTPPIAAAVTNAIRNAGGPRLRSHPLNQAWPEKA